MAVVGQSTTPGRSEDMRRRMGTLFYLELAEQAVTLSAVAACKEQRGYTHRVLHCIMCSSVEMKQKLILGVVY